ncbi:2TM domain-containing protein [Aquimarina sp. ERC-38]|uniref:2TM domain-containing protein n=1 Tax=Aquimarina sp. ERC-38 TaxID=2949996 RepID=UPI0022464A10|nr:2TM domain-containing protein [Aquimarina sp. ERC-38]UZO80333.1 2TM domain-containing protein [Aquimarina sp. ERC-38]
MIPPIQNETEKYYLAKKRVEEEKAFYQNLISYLIFTFLFGGFNYYVNQWDYPWFLWGALGWGIGVAFHAMKTFQILPFLGKDWEQRKIREYMEQEQNTNLWE